MRFTNATAAALCEGLRPRTSSGRRSHRIAVRNCGSGDLAVRDAPGGRRPAPSAAPTGAEHNLADDGRDDATSERNRSVSRQLVLRSDGIGSASVVF
jgi:hypothetical protein